jgi:hypothetical protein
MLVHDGVVHLIFAHSEHTAAISPSSPTYRMFWQFATGHGERFRISPRQLRQK